MSSKGKRKPAGGGGRGGSKAAVAAAAKAAALSSPPPVSARNSHNTNSSSGKKKSSSSSSAPAAAAAGKPPPGNGGGGVSSSTNNDLPEASYLITCDIPTKQYIHYLNEIKSADKKFILEELDETHLLVKLNARVEIEQKIEAWMDENVFSAIEKVGEDLDIS